jgi:hypothetical protein
VELRLPKFTENFFGNRVAADVISKDEVIPELSGPLIHVTAVIIKRTWMSAGGFNL